MPPLNDEDEKKLRTELEEEKKKSKKLEDDLEAERKTKKGKKEEDEDEGDEEDEDEGKDEGEDLGSKAKKARKAEEDKKNETKRVESALKFNLGVEEFVKGNKDLLPNEISDILKAAEKETYDGAIDKANALRAAFVKSFFAVQANLETLTTSQKSKLEDYLKLTQKGREDKAKEMYEDVFEPALETLKKIKKAEDLGKARSGFATGTKVEDEYKERLIKNSLKNTPWEKK